ncbi:MAG: hypothetical protein AAF591_15015 [Verrucomicrobiota bacterium]
MKPPKVILIGIGVLALAIITGMLWRSASENPGSTPASRQSTAATSHSPGDPNTPPASKKLDQSTSSQSPVSVPPPPSKPRGPIEHTTAGKKPYDTGIKNDPRVSHTNDGKHVFNESIAIARQLHAPNTEPEEDVSRLNDIVTFYRTLLKQNPEAGDNQSIVAALTGENEKNIVVFPPDHPALNGNGQLLDRWQTPYFFHALSGNEMEIFSAGPDQIMGTNDDIAFTDRDHSDFLQGLTEEPDPGFDE